jgi:hypothetical protein
MRLQTILFGGPYDHTMVVVNDKGDGWPAEIRVGDAGLAAAHDSDKIRVAAYAREDVSEGETFGVFLGAYKYVGDRESYPTLVHVWL